MGKNRHLKSTAIILIIALLTLLLSPVSATTEAVTRTTETINQLQQPFASVSLANGCCNWLIVSVVRVTASVVAETGLSSRVSRAIIRMMAVLFR